MRIRTSQVALPLGLPVEPVPGNENATEIYYSVNVTPAITVRPNIQLICAPGGIHEAEDVVVFGLHLSINF